MFNRNEMNLGGTNGLADFKTIFGVPLNQPSTQRMLYVVTALTLVAAWALCRWITRSRAGKVLVAIRDSETRVLFSGYSPASYKLFVFVVSASLAGRGRRALRAPGRHHHAGQDRRAALDRDGGVGGRGRARDPDRRRARAPSASTGSSRWLTTSYPDLWLLFLGALFMGVVLFFPDGVVGALGARSAQRAPADASARWRSTRRHLGQATLGASRASGSDTTA